jgi:hypothetical protein
MILPRRSLILPRGLSPECREVEAEKRQLLSRWPGSRFMPHPFCDPCCSSCIGGCKSGTLPSSIIVTLSGFSGDGLCPRCDQVNGAFSLDYRYCFGKQHFFSYDDPDANICDFGYDLFEIDARVGWDPEFGTREARVYVVQGGGFQFASFRLLQLSQSEPWDCSSLSLSLPVESAATYGCIPGTCDLSSV